MDDNQDKALEAIAKTESALTARFKKKLILNTNLDRTLVSFQANKKQNGYRWFKYKEGFSASLISYICRHLGIESGRLLDPFAGSGAAMFAASNIGIASTGIELLPVGREIIDCRKRALNGKKIGLMNTINRWIIGKPWKQTKARLPFSHLRITKGAFPEETEIGLERYLAAVKDERDSDAKAILRFAAMCVLEEISYTRKDGQYLRWDQRSGRRQGARPFDKGTIYSFDVAIVQKLAQICDDIRGDAPRPVSRQRQSGRS